MRRVPWRFHWELMKQKSKLKCWSLHLSLTLFDARPSRVLVVLGLVPSVNVIIISKYPAKLPTRVQYNGQRRLQGNVINFLGKFCLLIMMASRMRRRWRSSCCCSVQVMVVVSVSRITHRGNVFMNPPWDRSRSPWSL